MPQNPVKIRKCFLDASENMRSSPKDAAVVEGETEKAVLRATVKGLGFMRSRGLLIWYPWPLITSESSMGALLSLQCEGKGEASMIERVVKLAMGL